MKLLTKSQSQDLDRIAITEMGISGATLMWNAGKAVATSAREMLSEAPDPRVVIFCGKGNNGGDGYKAALDLHKHRIKTQIIVIPKATEITGDARSYYIQCIEQKIDVVHSVEAPTETEFDLIIDSIFGTGFSGEIQSPVSEIVNWINKQVIPVLAVDIPTGVNAVNGKIATDAVKADITVTMGFQKVGMQLEPGRQQCGDIHVADIGFPNQYSELEGLHWSLINPNLPKELLTPPAIDTYKHKQGKVLIIAGSRGMTGAATLSSLAALRSGSGLVKTCAPSSLNSIYETNIIEGMTISCEDSGTGYLRDKNFEQIMTHLTWCDCILIGPGLGGTESTVKLIEKIIQNSEKSIVIDADALRPFALNSIPIESLNQEIVLTPHLGEFESITGISQDDILSDFTEFLTKFMSSYSGTLVLKCATTISLFGDRAVVNTTGNQGLATGGAGDVLSGLIAGLIAQGISSFEAAQLGVFIHGVAADLVWKKRGFRGLCATDLLDAIPEIIRTYEV
ncbi:NAD(P)H-hydrate dehydratase [Candidatus Neomarinimicrobiota bacterium]